MTNLLKGIEISCHQADVEMESSRVWISAGTMPANAIMYSEKAFIPIPSWRELTVAEKKLLVPKDANATYDTCVGIIRLPDSVLARFKQLGIREVKTVENLQAFVNRVGCKQAVEEVIEYIKPYCLNNYKPIYNGIAGNPPGLSTVTFDGANGCYIGLHLDSWDKLPINKRHQAANRICINLGVEDRFLLFINLTLMRMLELLGISQPEDVEKYRLRTDLGQEFMSRFPDYPVIKVRIAPGEAYIAPTENMIHDGCTAGKRHFDLHLTFRGYFKVARAKTNAGIPGFRWKNWLFHKDL